ncbi:Eco57I restriction-modification methylase domain-containing protein [Mesoflavibacter sp. CH_XMU1404-2]|uniref:Eco57I restriction-modification methylase domain-containing protein n=1 Tax=Mesoflavibacter sp. CH_XMU1404-2 TaxID=3107766 RepID=UPI003008D195
MSLYQPSVLKHYLKLQDSEAINKAYSKYKKYFLNPTIQDNIRSSKEEEYQGIFLTELFVNVLDYTLKPKANFNLVAEYKNQNNARKADGAILDNDIAIGVIELKGTNTKDLESIRKQAFDYKANQKGCVYVITSNFEKLRFYINDATEFEEFNLFELTPERFELLYICLQKDNVLNNTPLKIKEQSVVEEEQITKQFYKDYSLFKRELFRDLVKRNASKLKNLRHSELVSESHQTEEEKAELLKLEKNVKLTLFKKSQKLIDRYLFIFFAEDRGLLPPNSTQQILDKWKADVDFGDDRPLYVLFKQYFNFLDTGRAGTTKRAEIYAYNGGLFKEDKTLDSLDIDSDLLYKHTSKLAAYDFESQVDVNILGHIFENSLNEIESVNAEIEGADFDKQKSKRKKDGVFYTPKYITKYIVENTVGKLCEEKKTELGFKEEEYFKGRKNRQKATITKLVDILDTYRNWLLQLTICDPACGSGAFLNQALNFLIAEHQYIDELKTKVLGGGLQFPDIENTILENNIYGVDLNEESVEIAKLSLWLRTAQPRRKLNDLSSNIKCGNSLIDSKAVAGDKAFNWETQFPKVFEKGGFDVIIGNPPYVQNSKDYFSKYITFKCSDLYAYFYEKGTNLLKSSGYLGFITPSSFLTNIGFKSLRDFLLKYKIEVIIDLGENVFADASVDSGILILNNQNTIDNNVVSVASKDFNFQEIEQSIFGTLEGNMFNIYLKPAHLKLSKKIEKKSILLSELVNFSRGVEFGFKSENVSDIKTEQFPYPIICGGDLSRNVINYQDKYVNYNKEDLKIYKPKSIYTEEKILIRRIGNDIISCYDDTGLFNVCDVYNVQLKNKIDIDLKFISILINSKLINLYFETKFKTVKKLFPKIPIQYLKLIPVVLPSKLKENTFVKTADYILNLNIRLLKVVITFQKYLTSKFQLEKLSKKLQNWHELEFGDFIKELNKAIKANNKQRVKDGLEEIPTLTKKDEFEWLDLFEDNKQKAQALQTQINQTDKEIDAMVYQLYGLTDEEIQIVENS